jgi:putative membrane protein
MWLSGNGGTAVSDNDDNVAETEPDYRFTLANERTYLAWQRTALGLLAAAVAVVQLVPELSIAGARHVLGVILALLAMLTAGMGILRWRQVDRAMRRNLPLPRHPTPVYLGIGLVAVGLLALGLIVVKAVAG